MKHSICVILALLLALSACAVAEDSMGNDDIGQVVIEEVVTQSPTAEPEATVIPTPTAAPAPVVTAAPAPTATRAPAATATPTPTPTPVPEEALSLDIVQDTVDVLDLREEMQTSFTLTIHYVFTDGTTAAPTYQATVETGESYGVVSPALAGFIASNSNVSGTMPKHDLEYTVLYVPQSMDDEALTTVLGHKVRIPGTTVQVVDLFDYMTPLGLGGVVTQVGVCFE